MSLKYLEVGGKKIELDEDGFLKDPMAWNEEVAKILCREECRDPETGELGVMKE
ncbi:MAG: TusE/DsrC/DsvC family sulfur relay protein, partial [Caldivirga sp.]